MSIASYDLKTIENIPHHKSLQELTDYLCHKTGKHTREFFQTEIAYFLGLIPSAMRVVIDSPERGEIPVNIYSIALATSGFGKGHSVGIMEDVISKFRSKYTSIIAPGIAEKSIFDLAIDIAATKGGSEQEEIDALTLDFKKQGHAPFIFDSGTGPALKQLRYKLLLSGSGAINFQMDEIGSNLVGNSEILNILLELYDLGRVKTKLIKNTAESERGRDIAGSTPANVLMFGTTSKLFDGSKTEDEFYSFLETGYARRCFFGIGAASPITHTASAKDIYLSLISKIKAKTLVNWRNYLEQFADEGFVGMKIKVPKDVGIELVHYRLYCEYMASLLPEHEAIQRAELSHRYFKSLKMAGVYAFLDKSPEITIENLHQAIKLAEESGRSFKTLLNRERNFVRLAKYIAQAPNNLTHADLVEDLPYYPNSTVPRREILDLAMAWGVGNHVVITRKVVSGVEFFSGSTLKETDLKKLVFSFSDHFASDYVPQEQPFEKMPRLLGADGLHWCNHTFDKEHRKEDNVIPGFNCLVVDVDGAISLDEVHKLLKDYTYITATTKRHTKTENRFRLIMPTNYILHLDKADYREFMDSFLLWLPFESDTAANQRSKKWMTNPNSEIHINKTSELVNVLPFIPKTKNNNEYINTIADLGKLDNLERWFLGKMDIGNRNNILLNYAMMLCDAGMEYDEVSSKVLSLNSSSKNPLKKSEVESTVLKSVGEKY